MFSFNFKLFGLCPLCDFRRLSFFLFIIHLFFDTIIFGKDESVSGLYWAWDLSFFKTFGGMMLLSLSFIFLCSLFWSLCLLFTIRFRFCSLWDFSKRFQLKYCLFNSVNNFVNSILYIVSLLSAQPWIVIFSRRSGTCRWFLYVINNLFYKGVWFGIASVSVNPSVWGFINYNISCFSIFSQRISTKKIIIPNQPFAIKFETSVFGLDLSRGPVSGSELIIFLANP